jgi:hypothetical protein
VPSYPLHDPYYPEFAVIIVGIREMNFIRQRQTADQIDNFRQSKFYKFRLLKSAYRSIVVPITQPRLVFMAFEVIIVGIRGTNFIRQLLKSAYRSIVVPITQLRRIFIAFEVIIVGIRGTNFIRQLLKSAYRRTYNSAKTHFYSI